MRYPLPTFLTGREKNILENMLYIMSRITLSGFANDTSRWFFLQMFAEEYWGTKL
jgi:hypothetical protein